MLLSNCFPEIGFQCNSNRLHSMICNTLKQLLSIHIHILVHLVKNFKHATLCNLVNIHWKLLNGHFSNDNIIFFKQDTLASLMVCHGKADWTLCRGSVLHLLQGTCPPLWAEPDRPNTKVSFYLPCMLRICVWFCSIQQKIIVQPIFHFTWYPK